MFKRKQKAVDPNRPEAVLANEMFDLAASGNRDGLRTLLDPPRFKDETWNDVLATYMRIIAEEPAAQLSLRDVISESRDDMLTALTAVEATIDSRDWSRVKPMTPGVGLTVMFVLANCIANEPHAILRLSLWTVTGQIHLEGGETGH